MVRERDATEKSHQSYKSTAFLSLLPSLHPQLKCIIAHPDCKWHYSKQSSLLRFCLEDIMGADKVLCYAYTIHFLPPLPLSILFSSGDSHCFDGRKICWSWFRPCHQGTAHFAKRTKSCGAPIRLLLHQCRYYLSVIVRNRHSRKNIMGLRTAKMKQKTSKNVSLID